MDKQFYADQMKIITRNYGKDEYTPDRVQIIWDICQDLPNYSFGKIIRHFLMTRSVKYPPLPTHFHEEYLNQRKLINSQEIKHIERTQEPEENRKSLSEILQSLGHKSLMDAIRGGRKNAG